MERTVLRAFGIDALRCRDCGQRFFDHRLLPTFVNLVRRHSGGYRLAFIFTFLVSAVAFTIALPQQNHSNSESMALFGDSITANWWSLTQMKELFGMHIVNRGASGDFTFQMISRFDKDVIQLHPRVVVILGGTNDILRSQFPAPIEPIEHNLQSMAEMATRNGIHVVIGTLPPVGEYNADKPPSLRANADKERIENLNSWIKSEANNKHYALADYHAVLADFRGHYSQDMSADGIHPSIKGYQLMVPVAVGAIQKAK
jgi:acyl-CoA thioesterase-1